MFTLGVFYPDIGMFDGGNSGGYNTEKQIIGRGMIMRNLRFVIVGIVVLLLTSCNAVSYKNNRDIPLVLTLEISQREVHSFDDLQCQIILLNQSDTSVLVHKRLWWMPFPDAPPSAIEMLILISDSHGNFLYNVYFPKYEPPNEGTLGVLQPGEQIMKSIHLNGSRFGEDLFKYREAYTIVAIYRNHLDVTKNIIGGDVSFWVGSVRSNEEYFIILP